MRKQRVAALVPKKSRTKDDHEDEIQRAELGTGQTGGVPEANKENLNRRKQRTQRDQNIQDGVGQVRCQFSI
jgi:hypothetical protein